MVGQEMYEEPSQTLFSVKKHGYKHGTDTTQIQTNGMVIPGKVEREDTTT